MALKYLFQDGDEIKSYQKTYTSYAYQINTNTGVAQTSAISLIKSRAGLTGLTFSAWVYSTSVKNDSIRPACNLFGGTDKSVLFGMSDGFLHYSHYDGSTLQSVKGQTKINDGIYHHVAVTHDALTGDIVLYVDGNVDGTGNIPYYDNATFPYVNRIGGTDVGTYPFLGRVAEITIWTRPISADEIIKCMYVRLIGNESGLVSYWKIDYWSTRWECVNTVSGAPTLIFRSINGDAGGVSNQKFFDGTMYTLGFAPASLSMFTQKGIDVLADVPITMITAMNAPELLCYSDTVIASKSIKLTFAPKPQLIKATGDINLTKAGSIDKFTLTATQTGGGMIRIIVSFDMGNKWFTLDSGKWVEVKTNDFTAIKEKGLSPTQFNTVTTEQWESLRNYSDTVRFAYYIDMNASTDVANTDLLTMQVDMFGEWMMGMLGADYQYEYVDNHTLQVNLLTNGDFKVNY